MYKRIRIMKRLAFIMMALLLALMPAAAQNYRDSRYYNSRTDRLDYRYNYNSPYYGFRIGPAFTFVNSDDSRLDGGYFCSFKSIRFQPPHQITTLFLL